MCKVSGQSKFDFSHCKQNNAVIEFLLAHPIAVIHGLRYRMDHCGGASVDYYCHPIVIKPTSFYEQYRRPCQLISRESYPAQQVPTMTHHRRDVSPYHQSYHHHHHHNHNYDDVMESRCVTSFTELQPASRGRDRSVVVQPLGGSTWTSTPSSFTPPHHCKYSYLSRLGASMQPRYFDHIACPAYFNRQHPEFL